MFIALVNCKQHEDLVSPWLVVYEKDDVWNFQTKSANSIISGGFRELLMELSGFYINGNVGHLNACIEQNQYARQYEHAFVVIN